VHACDCMVAGSSGRSRTERTAGAGRMQWHSGSYHFVSLALTPVAIHWWWAWAGWARGLDWFESSFTFSWVGFELLYHKLVLLYQERLAAWLEFPLQKLVWSVSNLCFYIVYSCHVSTVLCHTTVFMDTCHRKNSCLGAPALWAK